MEYSRQWCASSPGWGASSSVYRSARAYSSVREFQRVAPAAARPASRRLQSYDPRWSTLFAAERQRIAAALANTLLAVEHVGSSAIPGLAGRNEIDILVGVRRGTDFRASVQRLSALGYGNERRSPPDTEPWALLLKPGAVPVELLIVEHDGALWKRHLWLRDYLRDSPARARA
jgi:GrpB-like predicted nucleotidyltransferase (UPF0157 family)